jgi:hypothetical protein
MADGPEAVAVQIGDEAANGPRHPIQNPAALLQVLAELEAEFEHLFAEWHARANPPAERQPCSSS